MKGFFEQIMPAKKLPKSIDDWRFNKQMKRKQISVIVSVVSSVKHERQQTLTWKVSGKREREQQKQCPGKKQRATAYAVSTAEEKRKGRPLACCRWLNTWPSVSWQTLLRRCRTQTHMPTLLYRKKTGIKIQDCCCGYTISSVLINNRESNELTPYPHDRLIATMTLQSWTLLFCVAQFNPWLRQIYFNILFNIIGFESQPINTFITCLFSACI